MAANEQGAIVAKTKWVLGLVAIILALDVRAAVTTLCAADCAWSVSVDGVQMGSGMYAADPVTGNITLGAPFVMDLGGGAFVRLDSMSGNIDPILGFAVSAGTGAAGQTFSFNFSLPIALAGKLHAGSSVSYSLASLSSAGAQVTPLGAAMVVAQEVDTSVGGLAPLNKGVNVGTTYTTTAGPATTSSPLFTADSTLIGDLAYDLMSVTVAFALSPQSQVGMSGFVQQEIAAAEAPLPAAALLFAGGLGFFGAFARHKVTGGASRRAQGCRGRRGIREVEMV
ncbi:MAG TPA: hypothetical protein VKE95_21665, partial [Burkholderiales bacterium]|nr:hypothetical protein [Burkholderiales bacterium]